MSFNFGLNLVFTMLFSFGSSTYLCNRRGNSLDNAISRCRLKSGTLITSNHREIDLSELMKDNNITELWTSNITEVAFAVEYKGCYNYSKTATQNHAKSLKGINLVDCQSACDNNYNLFPVYGLYNNECICIYPTEEVDIQLFVSNQSCFKNCSIESLEFCSDHNLIALYKRKDKTEIKITGDVTANKCVSVNSSKESTENCEKILPYQCGGKIYNGTFLDAIDKCGQEVSSKQGSTNSVGYSWKPMFFPTLNRIEQFDFNRNVLKMRICKSLVVDGNKAFLRERNCTDSLPYICEGEVDNTTSKYFNICLSKQLQPSLSSITRSIVSPKNNILKATSDIFNASFMPYTGRDFTKQLSGESTKTFSFEMTTRSVLPESTNENKKGIKSTITSSTLKSKEYSSSKREPLISSTSAGVIEEHLTICTGCTKDHSTSNIHLAFTKFVTPSTGSKNKQHFTKSKTALILGLACGAVAIVVTIIVIIVIRKRCKNVEKKNENDLVLDAVQLNPITDNQEGPDILNNENAVLYSVAVPFNTAPASNQTNDFYAAVNKTNDTDNQNEDSSLATPVSSAIQTGNNEDISGMYAVVTKVKKKTTNEETSKDAGNDVINPLTKDSKIFTENYDNNSSTGVEKHTGNNQGNVSVGSDERQESGTFYSLSAGADYDHLDLSGNTGVLPVESDALYDHAAPGNNDTDDMYDSTQHKIKQHGLNDTYDHFTAL